MLISKDIAPSVCLLSSDTYVTDEFHQIQAMASSESGDLHGVRTERVQTLRVEDLASLLFLIGIHPLNRILIGLNDLQSCKSVSCSLW